MREDWVKVKIGNVLNVARGGSPRPIKAFVTDHPDGTNWIKIGDTKVNSKYIDSTAEKIKPVGHTKTRLVKKGDLLLSNSMSFGRPYILKIDGAIHDGWLVLSNKGDIILDSDFLFHLLSSPIVFTQFDQLAKGSTVKNLNTGIVESVVIPLIPLPEQRAIVAKIEQLFSELDNGIANFKTALEQLKVYRQAALKKAFEGELTKAWRAKQKDLPTAEDLLEQIRVERKKVSNVQASITNQDLYDFSPLPEKWFYGYLELVAEAIDPQPSHRTPPKVEGGIPYIGTADIDKVTGKIDLHSARKVSQSVLTEHRNRYKLLPGDFVIGKIGTIGKPFFIPTNVELTLSANVVLVQCNRNIAVPEYLFYLSKSPLIEKQFENGAKATTQAAFGIKKVRTLIIPICSIIEQHQVVQEIESRLSVCDKVEETIKDSLEKAEALRQSILKKAFEGKLLTEQELQACRQQPEWEPAEKLLERIKKEGGKVANRKSKKTATAEAL